MRAVLLALSLTVRTTATSKRRADESKCFSSSHGASRNRAGPAGGSPAESKSSKRCCLEPISKSFEEDNEAGQLEKAEEILGVVLPANEDPALPLNPGEEALDEPASHVAA